MPGETDRNRTIPLLAVEEPAAVGTDEPSGNEAGRSLAVAPPAVVATSSDGATATPASAAGAASVAAGASPE